MAKSVDEKSILKNMQRKDNDNEKKNLNCIICNNLIVDAYKTHCGCQYCRVCIVGYLEEGGEYCKGGTIECMKEILVLLKSVFKCPDLDEIILNLSDDCHNRVSIKCPSIDLFNIPDKDDPLDQNLKEKPEIQKGDPECCTLELPKISKEPIDNNVTLRHDAVQVTIVDLKGYVEKIVLEIINKKDLKKTAIENREYQNEEMSIQTDDEMKDMPKRMEDMGTEMRDRMEDTTKCIEEETKEAIEEMRRGMEDLKKEIEDLREKVRNKDNDVTGELEQMKTQINFATEYAKFADENVDKLRQECEKYQLEMVQDVAKKEDAESVANAVNGVRSSISEMMEMIKSIDVGTNKMVPVGHLSFTVDMFSARMKAREVLQSPYFYSHANGYKLRLLVHPGGCLDGVDKNLSIFILSCKGEYDELLPWPCMHTVHISIGNQRNKLANYVMPEGKMSSQVVIEKSTVEDVPWYGYSTFISHATLQATVGLLVEDSVVIICDVRAPRRPPSLSKR